MDEQKRNIVKLLQKIKEGKVDVHDLSEDLRTKIKEAVQEIEKEDKLIDPRNVEDDPDMVEPDDKKSINEYGASEQQFFQRPLIDKAFTRLKRIWQQGGKKNERLLYNDVKQEKDLLAPMVVEMIPNRDYQKFLEDKNYKDDLNERFLKKIYMYFNEVAKIDNNGEIEERQLSEKELEDVYNSLNVYRFHVFIESIIKFRKFAFKEPVIND